MARTLLAILILLLVLVIAAVATNFLDIRTSGELKAPSFTVQGGEVPSISVDTKQVVVKTRDDMSNASASANSADVPVVQPGNQ